MIFDVSKMAPKLRKKVPLVKTPWSDLLVEVYFNNTCSAREIYLVLQQLYPSISFSKEGWVSLKKLLDVVCNSF